MGFSTYSGALQITTTCNAQLSGPSSALGFPATVNNASLNAKTSFSTGANVVGGINQEAISILTIAASGSATINLQALTNVLQQASIVLVRLKKYLFWLLSPNDDSVNGTNCSSVVIQGGATNPNTLNLGGTAPTLTLTGVPTGSGGKIGHADDSAAGIAVSATACNIKIANSDGANAAAVFYNVAGADS